MAGTGSSRAPEERILSREGVVERYARPRSFRLVFTNGCFDLLHAGHVSFLHRAAALGDRLLVAVNSDESTRRLKGPDRPLQPAERRAYVLAGLRGVDAVTIFEEDTPAVLVELLLPDVLAKGADYRGREVVGRKTVEEAGGRVELLELVSGAATSALVERIRGG